jgi:glycosyltransferase involved in cell wall biosynthesis
MWAFTSIDIEKLHINQIHKIGIVVIGRNEGTRLKSSLRSCLNASQDLVYVDSASTDDSLEIATELEIKIVNLDPEKPLTAARARNAGFEQLVKNNPDIEYVQFVDGDCELIEGWISGAVQFLDVNSGVALACGHLHERHPESSVFNLLADIEWSTSCGKICSSGGIFLVRVQAFLSVDGFRVDLIAGEEPEFCIRLRSNHWDLYKLDLDMATHDADMHHFYQWWKRSVRDGYAFAEGSRLHGRTKYKHKVKEKRSAILWGAILPVTILLLGISQGWLFLAVSIVYPLQVIRISFKGQRDKRTNIVWAFFIVLRKTPEFLGIATYNWLRFLGRNSAIIEHK